MTPVVLSGRGRRSATSSWRARIRRPRCRTSTGRSSATPNDVSALVGRGQTLLALEREADALAAFEAALAVDPSLTELARRVEVLRFRGAEQNVERARQAARDGRLDEAIAAYTRARSPARPTARSCIASSPPSSGSKGQTDDALEHFRKAVSLDPADATSLVQIGEILDARGDFEGAAKAYADALATRAGRRRRARGSRRCAPARRWRGCPRSIARSIGARRSRAAIWPRSSASGSRRCSRAARRARRRAHHRHPQRTGRRPGSWPSRAPASWSRSPTTRFQPRTVVRRVDLAQAVGAAAAAGRRIERRRQRAAVGVGAAEVHGSVATSTSPIRRRRRRWRPA